MPVPLQRPAARRPGVEKGNEKGTTVTEQVSERSLFFFGKRTRPRSRQSGRTQPSVHCADHESSGWRCYQSPIARASEAPRLRRGSLIREREGRRARGPATRGRVATLGGAKPQTPKQCFPPPQTGIGEGRRRMVFCEPRAAGETDPQALDQSLPGQQHGKVPPRAKSLSWALGDPIACKPCSVDKSRKTLPDEEERDDEQHGNIGHQRC